MLARGVRLAFLCLACATIPAWAHAHGGRGRTYTATGPISRLSGPAPYYYGGFNNVPLAVGGTQVWSNSQYAARPAVHQVVVQRRGWRHRVR